MGRHLPTVLQTEASECGLACLTMISRYYGHKIDLTILRQKHLISLSGSSLKNLIQIATSLHLSTRPLRLDMEHLKELQLPAILHWDMNHYIVLKKIRGKKAHIIDPAIGQRIMSLSRVSNHFSGIALELTPISTFSPIEARLKPHLNRLWSHLVGLKRALSQTLILSILLLITTLSLPFYLQIIVDGVLPSGNQALLLSLFLGFLGLTAIRAVSELTRGWAILAYGHQMSLQMIGNVFHHLIRLPVSYFEKRHVGDLISRMGSTKPIQEAITQSLVAVLIDGIMAVLMLGIMFAYSAVLTWIVLGFSTLLILASLIIYPHMRRTQEEAIYSKALENTHLIETIRAHTSLKLFGRESERETVWRNLYADFINASLYYGRWDLWQKFSETLLVGLQIICVIFVGVKIMLADNNFSLGMLLAFLGYRQYFTDSLTQLLKKAIEFNLLSLHLERLSDIIFAAPENLSSSTNHTPLKLQKAIHFKNIAFRYSNMDPWVIKDFNATIPIGKMTTFTGRSGGGKTTLMKLLLGLYPPSEGDIFIDSQSLSQIPLSQWRSHIGVVMQDDKLLSGTIAENISFFDPDMNMQKVVRAAQLAKVDTAVKAMPMNYLTRVGDMGSILSGGQKQRILLARALYHEPRIIILDEGTANLDSQTEEEIVETLNSMSLTRIIVAHRRAFIKCCDQLIQL